MINKTLINLFILFSFFYGQAWADTNDSLLHVLSDAIAYQEKYILEKEAHINDLKSQLEASENQGPALLFDLNYKLFKAYQSYQFDSAFTYARKMQETARSLGNKNKKMQAKIAISTILRSSGMYKEAFDSLNSINEIGIIDSLKIEYYRQKTLAHYDLAAYNSDGYYSNLNGQLGNQFVDSAIALADSSSLVYYKLKGLKAEAVGDHKTALGIFQRIVEGFDINLHESAMAFYSLGRIHLAMGDQEKSLAYIIRSAIADVKSVTKETVALMDLANILYEQGKLSLAYDFINQAADDAEFYGARHRILQISAILPEIESAKLASVEYQRKRLMIFLITVTLLSLLVIGFAIIIFRQYRQLRQTKKNLTQSNTQLLELNDKLKEANKIKEEYIGHSFTKDSEYLDKLDRFKKEIDRKLMSKKFDDLHHVLKSINLKQEREALFVKFDEIFLRLFPNFIKVFNSYFNEEDQFEIKNNQSLPIELRIFALIRIGITDHEQIASILGYSVRTIYNYKTKVKSKSILSNEEFEQKVMEIRTI